jgi:hypothetical protein
MKTHEDFMLDQASARRAAEDAAEMVRVRLDEVNVARDAHANAVTRQRDLAAAADERAGRVAILAVDGGVVEQIADLGHGTQIVVTGTGANGEQQKCVYSLRGGFHHVAGDTVKAGDFLGFR